MLDSKKGFTLVEMMIVVAIVVIFSGIGIVALADTIKENSSKQAQYEAHSGVIDATQQRNYEILAERSPKVPVNYIPVPNTGDGDTDSNGNKNGVGSNNGNGNGNGNVNGNGNNGTLTPGENAKDVHNKNQDDKENQNTNENDKDNVDKDVDSANNDNSKDNEKDKNNSSSHGHGWGVGTDKGHGQPDVTGKATLNANSKDDLQTNLQIKSTGNRGIKEVVITVSDNVEIIKVGNGDNGGRYICKVDGNTITVTMKNEGWVTSVTSLNVNNITWKGDTNASASYTIIYE